MMTTIVLLILLSLVISDEVLQRYKNQELVIKEMAEDSLRKEVQLKQVVVNIQNLLNNSRSSDKA